MWKNRPNDSADALRNAKKSCEKSAVSSVYNNEIMCVGESGLCVYIC